jgi:hypothetical protein
MFQRSILRLAIARVRSLRMYSMELSVAYQVLCWMPSRREDQSDKRTIVSEQQDDKSHREIPTMPRIGCLITDEAAGRRGSSAPLGVSPASGRLIRATYLPGTA